MSDRKLGKCYEQERDMLILVTVSRFILETVKSFNSMKGCEVLNESMVEGREKVDGLKNAYMEINKMLRMNEKEELR